MDEEILMSAVDDVSEVEAQSEAFDPEVGECEVEAQSDGSTSEVQGEASEVGDQGEASEVGEQGDDSDADGRSDVEKIKAETARLNAEAKAKAAEAKAKKADAEMRKAENEKRRLDQAEARGRRADKRLQRDLERDERRKRNREETKQRSEEAKARKAQQAEAVDESLEDQLNALLASLDNSNDPRMPSSDAVNDAAHMERFEDFRDAMEALVLTNLKPENIHQIFEYWAYKHFPPIEQGPNAGKPNKSEVFKAMQKRIEHGPTAAEIAHYVKKEKFLDDLGEGEDGKPDEQTLLLYKPDAGFYKYSKAHGVWEKKSDELIASVVSELIPTHWNDRKACAHATDALAHIVTKEAEFDMSPVMTFKNGVLSLGDLASDGGITNISLAPHHPEFYSTIGLDYEFDPNATCPMWDEYIDVVTNHNEARQAVLQEFSGYTLFPDFPLHIALFLVGQGGDGNGSNGKSVFLNTIKAVLGGDKNVSSIEFSMYGLPHYLAKLEGKLLNISTEIKANAEGCETAFKAITAGDSVTIKSLYKNPRDVILRAKCMHAINNFPRMTDLSDGIRRRMKFVEFVRIFNDDPHGPLEAKADKGLPDKLLTELPGIFNWCLRGYLTLKKRQAANPYFALTESPDQDSLMTQFVSRNSILSEFIEDCKSELDGKSKSTTELFEIYEQWTIDKKLHRMPRNSFSAKFKTIGKARGIFQDGPRKSNKSVFFDIKYPD